MASLKYFKTVSIKTDSKPMLRSVKTSPAKFWKRIQEKRALGLFHAAATRVPAYKDFLKKHKVYPEKIKTFADFSRVPQTSKKNYLQQYELEKLLWDGHVEKPLVYTSTSGSTGQPFYFPRGQQLDWQSSIAHEIFMQQGYRDGVKTTLVIDAFSMGVWIGGLITYKAFEMAAHRRDWPVSIITPGINKAEIYKALKNLAPHYEQTILTGYPPFVKDIVDGAAAEGVNLKKLNLRLLFAAESFSEKFREHVAKTAGIRNIFLDTFNIYGSADIGTMAYETPASILMRRAALTKPKLFKILFSHATKVPTLAQYNPYFICFEEVQESLVLTGDNAIPLIRYDIGDHGGVIDFDKAAEAVKDAGISFKRKLEEAKISNYNYKLPLVYVYERNDLSTTIYGLQIYPEIIREALYEATIKKHLTGKFTLMTKYDGKHNQFLEINLEMSKAKKASKQLHKVSLKHIVKHLYRKNGEFKELHEHLKSRALPKLVFWPAGHERYFKAGTKQIWSKH